MELKEVRSAIKNYPHIEKANSIELSITFESSSQKFHFTGLYNIFRFFHDQLLNWKLESLDNSNNVFDNSFSFFSIAIVQLESFVEERIINEVVSEENFDYYFQQIESNYLNPDKDVFPYDATEVSFLKSLNEKNKVLVEPAYNYFIDGTFNSNSKINIQGYILAYEFQNKENSVLFNNRESEKRNLSKMRADLANIKDSYENEVNLFQNSVKKDYQDYRTAQDDYISKSRKILADWLLLKKNNFNTLFNSSKDDITTLKDQYGTLLQLQEPVQYWNTRATELNKKANHILFWIGGASTIMIFAVYMLLWFTPEGLLESLFGGDKSKAIRWSFVFVIFISIFFVVIRALLKFMFSNFHLARDAEEREKLTYLYISLLSKGDVSEEERKIVFQALFSRSDTGLLKEDSSPTMPGVASIIEKMK